MDAKFLPRFLENSIKDELNMGAAAAQPFAPATPGASQATSTSNLYQQFFGLSEAPFSIAPNPEYLYMSAQHNEALAHLVYGVGGEGGFILLTGEVGTGKTTVCRCFLEQVPENTDVAVIINPKLSVDQLLENICEELGLEKAEGRLTVKEHVDRLNARLLESHAQGRRTVLIIDEAQNLSPSVLEQLRLLTNLETHHRKLLQIILLGQPELQAMFARPELRQLSQRVTARFHLEALSDKEVAAYVSHRMSIAGCTDALAIFTPQSIKALFKASHGIPRLMNVICDRALLGAYVAGQRQISVTIIKKAANEVFGAKSPSKIRVNPPVMLAIVLAVCACAALIAVVNTKHQTVDDAVVSSAQAPQAGTPQADWAMPDAPSFDNPAHSMSSEAVYVEVPSLSEYSTLRRDKAYEDLFAQWGHIYDAGSRAPCVHAQQLSLACLPLQGSVEQFSAMDRPGIIELLDDTGRVRYVNFIAFANPVSQTEALLVNEGRSFTVPMDDIRQRWSGNFELVWKPPEGYHGDIVPGTIGPVVKWLAGAISMADPQLVIPQDQSNYYGGVFVDHIKQLQRRFGLVDDGVVDVHTLIRINSLVDSQVPRL